MSIFYGGNKSFNRRSPFNPKIRMILGKKKDSRCFVLVKIILLIFFCTLMGYEFDFLINFLIIQRVQF